MLSSICRRLVVRGGRAMSTTLITPPALKRNLPARNIIVYVLRLKEKEKYYIGRTTDNGFANRMCELFTLKQRVPAWVKKYPPLEIAAIFTDCDAYDEDKITKVFMNLFGINNVRGGSYCSIELSETDKICLNKELYNVNSRCFICGSDKHWAFGCPLRDF